MKMIIEIEGTSDAVDQVIADLHSNSEYDNLDVTITIKEISHDRGETTTATLARVSTLGRGDGKKPRRVN